jgi:hypothetical protein
MDSHFPRWVLIGFIPPLLFFFYFFFLMLEQWSRLLLIYCFIPEGRYRLLLKKENHYRLRSVIEFYLVFDLNLIDI